MVATWSRCGPLNNKTGADELCMKFPTGVGQGRRRDQRPAGDMLRFIDTFAAFYARAEEGSPGLSRHPYGGTDWDWDDLKVFLAISRKARRAGLPRNWASAIPPSPGAWTTWSASCRRTCSTARPTATA